MKNRIQICSTRVCLPAILVACAMTPSLSFGQGGIPTPTPTPTPTQIPQQQQQTTGQQGQQQQTGGGRQTAQTSDGGIVDIDPSQAVQFTEFENTRNQGFVGATSTRIDERGFVGASSQLMGAAAADADATFGGGINTTAGTGASGGGGGGRGQANFGNQGTGFGNFGSTQFGQGAGSQTSFVVQRGGLRGSVKPSFTFQVTSDSQVSDQFSNNFSQLPQSQLFNGQYQVVVNNKKAIISGWVNSKTESDHLVAQLRFQPGIYEIENNLEIREK